MSELDELDAAAREASLDPARSILLEAPAGSGKTTVLTQRILALLARVDEPEEVLAITFTRKAAAEMRERVMDALRETEAVTSAHARRTSELAAAVRRRGEARGWSLEANPARLRIQTIDSLNHSIASRLPIAARTGGHLVVHDRADDLHRLAARRTLEDAQAGEALQEEIGLLFERLDNDWGRFERLLAEMLARRAHWLPLLLRGNGSSLAGIVEEGLAQLAGDTLRAARERLPAELLAAAADFAPRHARSLGGEVAQRLTTQLRWPAALGTSAAELPWWQCLASLALTREGQWRRQLNVRNGYPPVEARLRDAALEWIGRLGAIPGAREALADIAGLPPVRLDGSDALALEALARVLKFAAAELELTFQERGRVDHSCVAAAARRALTEDGQPTDLALRLGSAIRHILVDEFQDTSNEQFELLRSLTAGWEEGDGRTLFAVGDPMQSIYQFREAEVGLFLRARVHGVGSLPLEALRLTRNFRSLPVLVEFGNETFSRIFPPRDEPRASAVRHAPSVAARRDDSAALLGLTLTTAGEPAAEAAEVVRLVQAMRERAPGGSIAILVAARTHAAPLTRALLAAAIPVAGVDLVPLGEVPLVRDLAALTRALDHRGDRTAWLAILRAPWCGLALADLAVLARRGDDSTVWDCLGKPPLIEALSADARSRVRRFRAVMERSLAAAGRLPLAAWVESTWLALAGPSACGAATELADAEAFLRALAQRSAETDWRGPQELEELLGTLYASSAGAPADAVQVMTMHRAKGLEFDRVILPSLGRRGRSSPEPLLRWLDLPREREGSDLLLAPAPSATRRTPDPLNQYIKRLQQRRSDFERVRLLYVATTRARYELHLIGQTDARHPDRPTSGTLLEVLWNTLGARFVAGARERAQAVPAPAALPVPAAPPRSIHRLAADFEPPPPPPGIAFEGLRVANYEPVAELEFDWAGQTARHVGTVVHAALERLAREPRLPQPAQLAAEAPLLRAAFEALGVAPGEIAGAVQRALEALRRTLADPRGRWILDPSHRQAASELGLSGQIEGRLASVAIDRTFIDEQGQRWVIDFKTGVHRGGDLEAFLDAESQRYQPQLERYAVFARELGPEPVRAALYFPLLGAFRECPLGAAPAAGR